MLTSRRSNRLEHAANIGLDRHQKLDHNPSNIGRLLVNLIADAHREPSVLVLLDLDATNDRLHDEQEGRHIYG